MKRMLILLLPFVLSGCLKYLDASEINDESIKGGMVFFANSMATMCSSMFDLDKLSYKINIFEEGFEYENFYHYYLVSAKDSLWRVEYDGGFQGGTLAMECMVTMLPDNENGRHEWETTGRALYSEIGTGYSCEFRSVTPTIYEAEENTLIPGLYFYVYSGKFEFLPSKDNVVQSCLTIWYDRTSGGESCHSGYEYGIN